MKKALEPLILAWRVPELRQRLLFVLGAMIVFVFAIHIPVPNVDKGKLKDLINQSAGLLNFIDIFGGGALQRLSILALGIMPYITSSIVFQILTIAFPYFKELQKEGEYGRRKMAQWTRWATIVLTMVQSFMAAKALVAFGANTPNVSGIQFILTTMICLTAGTMFLLWLCEQITEKGVGNGISFIIFAGIVASLPGQMEQLGAGVQAGEVSPFSIMAMFLLFVATTYVIILVTQGERRIPIRYAPRHVGGKQVQAQRSYLPLKMAAAGVIPIIFAVSIVLFPGQIATFYLQTLPKDDTGSILQTGMGFNVATTIQNLFSPSSWVASLFYALLVLGFTYFYTAVIFDVRDLADNLKKFGGQIQGYAPGNPTRQFIDRVLTRITFAGGVFLALIALLQWHAPALLRLGNTGAGAASTLVGGTSLLIVVGVALEIMNNLDQQLKMRQYEGFVKQMKKGRL